MVTALALAFLAVALACAPCPAAVRMAMLWPPPRPHRRRRRLIAGPALIGVLAGMTVAGPGGALAGLVVTIATARRRRRDKAATDAAATAAELADAVSRISEELRAGGSPATALAGVDADGPRARAALAGAAVAARLGDGIPQALHHEAARRPELAADIERIATAWSLAERHGIPLAHVLGQAHRDIRWRIRFAATVRAQLAGPRATAVVLTALPLLGLGLGQLVGADPVGVLRNGPLGQVLLVLGVALAAAGAAWSDHILRSAMPR